MNDMTDVSKLSTREVRLREAQLFVPMSDEMLYDHPELITGPLVAYQPGHICSTWLSVELNPEDEPPITRKRRPEAVDKETESTGAGHSDPETHFLRVAD